MKVWPRLLCRKRWGKCTKGGKHVCGRVIKHDGGIGHWCSKCNTTWKEDK